MKKQKKRVDGKREVKLRTHTTKLPEKRKKPWNYAMNGKFLERKR